MTTNPTDGERWREVTTAEPCPICKHDGWCRVSPDGARVACRRESRGAKRTKRYKDGSEAYLHILRNDGRAAGDGKPRKQRRTTAKPSGDGKPAPVADAQILDRAYRLLLGELQLSADHRQDLQRRGLTDEAIDAGPYRTLPADTSTLALGLLRKLGAATYDLIPGFLRRGGMRINAPAGLLVPVRDVAGRIVAMKIRPDDPGDRGKYRYVTSRTTKDPDGPSPGSPAHIPAGIVGPAGVVRLTEGEIKADAAYRLSGVPTVAFPGVGSWRVVLPVLQALQAKTVRLAFDADAATNAHVARSLRECFHGLQAAGYALELEQWPIDAGKGIDDLLAAGGTPEVLTGDAARAAVDAIAAAAVGAGRRMTREGSTLSERQVTDDAQRTGPSYGTDRASHFADSRSEGDA